MASYGGHSMVAPLRRVIVKRPQEAFHSQERIEKEWMALNYTSPPNLEPAVKEHDHFVGLLVESGVEVLYLPAEKRTGLDSLYVHDPALVTDAGVVLFQTGKEARRGEGGAMGDAIRNWDVPVLGRIKGEGMAEGGDMVWLDENTLLAGRGFRTNTAGITSLQAMLEPLQVRVIDFDLPYWNGPDDVLHLMSFLSLMDRDLAVVHRPLMPAALFQLLQERGIRMIDVAEGEYDTLGCNVLTVAPRDVLMVKGNPKTRARLEAAGCRVREFEGNEIALKGSGGPTCLTRPLLRR